MTTEKNNAEFQDLNELIVGVAFALFWALGIWYFSKNNTTPELNQATPSIVKGAAGAAPSAPVVADIFSVGLNTNAPYQIIKGVLYYV